MADQHGYVVQFTDKPEMWDVDGYAVCIDGYGTLQFQINSVATTGLLAAINQAAPSSAIHDITQSANSSGIYKVHLKQTWNQLTHASFVTVCPSGSSPGVIITQVLSDTVANPLFGPGQSELQFVQFATVDPETHSASVLSLGQGLMLRLRLKNSSA